MKSKTITLKLPYQTHENLLAHISQANDGFSDGTITMSDVIRSLIDQSDLNIEKLRQEKVSVKKLLRNTMKEAGEIPIEELIKKLQKINNVKKGGKV